MKVRKICFVLAALMLASAFCRELRPERRGTCSQSRRGGGNDALPGADGSG